MTEQVVVTLPGRPLTLRLDPEALPSYLRARGWALFVDPREQDRFAYWQKDSRWVDVPLQPELPDYGKRLAESIEMLAAAEKRDAWAVADDLAPTPPGWPTLPAPVRAKVLNLLAEQARQAREAEPPDDATAADWRAQADGLDALARLASLPPTTPTGWHALPSDVRERALATIRAAVADALRPSNDWGGGEAAKVVKAEDEEQANALRAALAALGRGAVPSPLPHVTHEAAIEKTIGALYPTGDAWYTLAQEERDRVWTVLRGLVDAVVGP